jgi:two-component system chemotaxis response regulator CheB
VQDPDDALVAAMPQNAMEVAGGDHVIPIADLAPLLIRLTHKPVDSDRGAETMDPIERMPEIAIQDMARQVRNERRGQVSVMTCPECGGALWQVDDAGLLRFSCHVGHVYRGEVLLSEQTEALEAALWTAVRTFKEKWVLASQLAHREQAAGNVQSAARFREQAEQAIRSGDLIQRHLLVDAPPGGEPRIDGEFNGPAGRPSEP